MSPAGGSNMTTTNNTHTSGRPIGYQMLMQALCWVSGFACCKLFQMPTEKLTVIGYGVLLGTVGGLSLLGALYVAYHVVRFLCREYHFAALLLVVTSTLWTME